MKILYCYENQLPELKINHLTNLESLGCQNNQLTQLDLPNPNKINWINASDNYLVDLSFLNSLNSERLISLDLENNNFPQQDLSIFSQFINLKELGIGNTSEEKISQGIYNRFFGSLEFLRNLTKLETLNINNTNLDSGLEYLPESVERFSCLADYKKDARCQVIYDLLTKEKGKVETGYGAIKNFSWKLKAYKQKLQKQTQQQTQAQILQPTAPLLNPTNNP